jgi:hypothetical protein
MGAAPAGEDLVEAEAALQGPAPSAAEEARMAAEAPGPAEGEAGMPPLVAVTDPAEPCQGTAEQEQQSEAGAAEQPAEQPAKATQPMAAASVKEAAAQQQPAEQLPNPDAAPTTAAVDLHPQAGGALPSPEALLPAEAAAAAAAPEAGAPAVAPPLVAGPLL